MRLLILSSEFPPGPGGIGTHAFHLASQLAYRGLELHVLSPQDYASEKEISAFNASQPFEITRLLSMRNKLIQSYTRYKTVRQAVKTFKPDLMIASGSRAVYLVALLTLFRKTPWLVIGHGTEFGARNIVQKTLTRIACNQANGIICVSDYTKQVVEALGVNKPPIFVIHNGADQNAFYQLPGDEVTEFRKNAQVSGKFVLLTVGNVSDRKGQEVVIRALPGILDQVPNAVYWMAGLPQKQAPLTSLADQLGVAHAIRFWGKVPLEQLRMLYNACDLFLMTSRQLADGDFEGFGIAVIEAALCGKPAVVSDNSGLAEAVIDNQTGLLVPQNDPVATAQAVINLAQNPALLSAMATQAYHQAIAHQTWDHVGSLYLDVIHKIINPSS